MDEKHRRFEFIKPWRREIQNCFYFVLNFLLIALIVFLIYICVISLDSSNISSSLTTIASALTCVAATVSAMLASATLRESQRQYLDSRKKETFDRWYKELILGKYLESIKIFFDDCEELVNTFERIENSRSQITGTEYDERVMEEIIKPFTTSFTAIHRNIATDVSIINQKLSSAISVQFCEFQDEFLSNTEKRSINRDEMLTCVKNGYKNVISILLNFDVKMLDSSWTSLGENVDVNQKWFWHRPKN